jgi:anti-sigma B factor antagonist
MVVDLDLEESQRGEHHVLSVGGEIDVYTAPTLRERLDEVLNQGTRSLCIDLTGVQFLDSTGLGVLVGTMKKIGSEGSLVIVCNRPHILKVFEITGLAKVFDIRSSIDEV